MRDYNMFCKGVRKLFLTSIDTHNSYYLVLLGSVASHQL